MTPDELRALADALRNELPTADDPPDHNVYAVVRSDDLRAAEAFIRACADAALAAQPAQAQPLTRAQIDDALASIDGIVNRDDIFWEEVARAVERAVRGQG